MQVYYASIGQGDYAKAWSLWSPGAPSRSADAQAFAAGLEPYVQYRGAVGAPGSVEGAAGSLFIEIPVQLTGRLKSGQEVHKLGKATLRRVNDVPGSTVEQRLWRIERIDLGPLL